MSTTPDRRAELAQQIRAGCNQLLDSQPVKTDWMRRTSQLVLTLGLLPVVDRIRSWRDPNLLTKWEETRFRRAQILPLVEGSQRKVVVVSYGDLPPTISKRVEVHTKGDWEDFLTFTPKGLVVSSLRALGRGAITVEDDGEPSIERLQQDEMVIREALQAAS